MIPDGQGTLEERVYRLEELLRRTLSFGDPQNPLDATDTTAAGGASTAHSGRLENVYGAWVELTFEATDTEVVAYHNLDNPVVSSELNVRWFLVGLTHDGTAATGTSAITLSHEIGTDTLTTNALGLRCYVAATRTVDATHPVKATLFFIPAVRGIN